jgi:hypothetical protein
MEKTEPANSELEAIRSELQEEKREFAVPGSKKSKLAVATRALRHRNFQLFFSGQLISLVDRQEQTWAADPVISQSIIGIDAKKSQQHIPHLRAQRKEVDFGLHRCLATENALHRNSPVQTSADEILQPDAIRFVAGVDTVRAFFP